MRLIKWLLRPVYRYFKRLFGIINLKWALIKGIDKIVIGASGKFEKGWIATDIEYLNLLKEEDWKRFFTQDSLSIIMAEHVWEHLHPDDALIAAKVCYKFLKSGGHLRVAVPDGYHSDRNYIESVKPGGTGDGSFDHKILYNINSFTELFEKAGFRVKPLEYYDENQNFTSIDWNPEEGKIRRSKRFDPRNTEINIKYTSLIIDAIK